MANLPSKLAVVCLGTFAFAAAGAAGAACSSTSSDEPLEGSTYFGSDAGSASDAAAAPSDATTRAPGDSGGKGSGDDEASVAKDDAGDDSDAALDAGRDYGTDAATFYGASRCATANVLLCDGFENGSIDTTTWAVSSSSAEMPSVSTAQAARGSGSLHIVLSKLSSGYEAEHLTETKTFPAVDNRYFGRIFVRFVSLPAVPLGYLHWTIAAGTGENIPTDIRLSGQFNNDGQKKNLFGIGTDETGIDGGTGDWTQQDNDPTGDPTNIPLNKWMCVEWMYDGSANETRFWWDGVEHPSMHTTRTMSGSTTGNPFVLPTFTSQWLGFEGYQATSETLEAYFDEVAIDSDRIGCNL